MQNPFAMPNVIDVEASGFGRGSYPIEIGVVMADGRAHCFLIRPEPQWLAWDKHAEAVHGISQAQLLKHGKSAAEVAERLNDLLWGQAVYSDAWAHDSSWIGKLYDAVDSHPRFQVRSLREIIDDSQMLYWQQTRDRLTAEQQGQRHRASNDARLIQRTFEKSLEAALYQSLQAL